jgi:isopentenyl-diphosphate delta-isomerase
MEEFIDIISKDGTPTGKTASKYAIHKKGYYHNTVHVWFYQNSGHIVLAQRSATKLIYPLLWDVSVAGHVDAGEGIEDAAVREVNEELGISITLDSLSKISVTESFQNYGKNLIDNEFHHTFISELRTDITQFKIDTNEVQAVKKISFEVFQELIDKIDSSDHFVSKNKSHYQFVLDQIKYKTKHDLI